MADAQINRKRILKTFVELIQINSPSFHEELIGRHLIGMLRRLGCTVTRQEYDESFNIIGTLKGTVRSAPALILSAHMDTIEPTEGITYAVSRDRVRSTGPTVLGADDKSAIAQILEAVSVIREKRIPHGDIEIVLTSAEEKGLTGARHLDFSRLKGRHALVLDSGGRVGRLVVGAPTHHTYEMTVIGRSAHAGIEPERGISAIRAASRIISAVPDGRIDGMTTANIGIIDGGTATNVVPRVARIRGEVRSHTQAVLERTERKIYGTARGIAGTLGVRLMIRTNEEYRSFSIGSTEPFLIYLDDVMKRCRIKPAHVITGGGSDANIFHEKGIMAVNLSNGMQRVHSPQEYILLKDLCDGSRIVLEALLGIGQGIFPA